MSEVHHVQEVLEKCDVSPLEMSFFFFKSKSVKENGSLARLGLVPQCNSHALESLGENNIARGMLVEHL